MGELLQALTCWQTLVGALILFGFTPGLVLRTIVLLYPKDHPRRAELIGELYRCPRWERPFWVAEQFEVALFEGLPSRVSSTLRHGRTFVTRRYLEVKLLGLDYVQFRQALIWEFVRSEGRRPGRLWLIQGDLRMILLLLRKVI
jgi:hypothetical protein